MNKVLMIFVFVFLMSCTTTKPRDQIRYVNQPIPLNHPVLPIPPSNPNLHILVITDETIDARKAYVGFEYNEWLDFAKWMQTYKLYNKDLKQVIATYKAQDTTLVEEKIE